MPPVDPASAPPPQGASSASSDPTTQRWQQDARRFQTLCESAPLGIFECDRDGKIIYRNRQLAEILEIPPAEDFEQQWVARIHSDDFPALMAAWESTVRENRPLRHDYRMYSPTGALRWMRVHVMPQRHDHPSFLAMLEDVTSQRLSEQAVHESQERFRQIAENIDEIFWVTSPNLKEILYVSPASLKIWGRAPEEFYQRADLFLEGIHPADRPRVEEQIPRLQREPYDGTFRIVQPDGTVRIIRVRAFPVRNERGECFRLAGITQDITDARQVEDELKAERRFLEHLLQVQEGERKLIAYDIHDGFVQGVIAALMHLEAINAIEGLTADLRKRLEVPIRLLRESIAEARRMISGLRPPIIDEQGLVAAIEYLVSESASRPIKIEFQHDVQFQRLEPVLEGTLFRIVQEALTNVYRHSHAKEAKVVLTQAGERLFLVIEDWGVGFDPRQTTGRQFGLRGIRERARLFGGNAVIHSSPGSGTRISVELPVQPTFHPGPTS